MKTFIKKEPNENYNLEIEVKGKKYLRYPVASSFIHIKEDISPIFEEIKKEFQPGDWIAISEKYITIAEGRLIHRSLLKPGWLAKTIFKLIKWNLGPKNYQWDPGFAIPEKIQAAIFITGWWRMFAAMIIGMPLTALAKLMGKKTGIFYIIAGNRVAELDGPYHEAMPPFDEFVKVYPENPQKTCQDIENKYGIPAIIVDSNNINVEILGMSLNFPISHKRAREILLDNPMGQEDQLTPIILVREKK